MPNLRDARDTDFESILRLNLESEKYLSPLSRDRLEALSKEAAYLKVMESEGEVVAFLLAFREGAAYDSENYRWFDSRYESFLYIDRVVVSASQQGKGLGALLYEDLFRFAREHQMPRVTCELDVEPPNLASARFHGRFGFREIGSQWVAGGKKRVSLQEAMVGNLMNVFDHRSGEHLEIDGARIYYEVCGNQEGPPLVVLHGGFGNIEDFNGFLPEVGSDYRIIGIDSRGHGKSTLGSSELTYERLQRDVQRVLEHLGLPAVRIIGFSDGGIVGYRLASLTSLKVEKLVTIGADSRPPSGMVREILSRVTGESWKAKFPATYDAYQQQNPEPAFDAFARASVKMWLDAGPSGYPGEAVRKISCPLLIVRGDDDHLVSLRDLVDLQETVEGSKLLNIPFAGHVAFDDQKDIFLISLRQFLAD